MPLMMGKKNMGHNISTEMDAGKPKRQAIAIAMNMARKNKPEEKKMSEGGKCYACGGKVGMSQGGYAEEWNENKAPEWKDFSKDEEVEDHDPMYATEPEGYSEGGGVDSYDAKSIMDADGDSDDLEFSPEVEKGHVDNEEDPSDEKRNKFLRAYFIHRNLRG